MIATAWSERRLTTVSVLAHLVLVCCGVRHVFFWGGAFAPFLQAGEAIGLAVFTALAGLGYLHALRRAPELDVRFLVRAGALLAFVAALAPPFLSDDLWDYLARGRVEALGANPYTTTVSSLLTDPAIQPFAQRARWPEWVMPYGPLAAVLQFVCALPDSPWVGAYAWKAGCAAAHVATGVVLLRTLRVHADEAAARRGLVLWLWNPWLLLESCGSGHNDALVALFLAITCLAIARARYAPAAAGYGAAMLIEHGSPPLAPLLLVAAWRQRRLPMFMVGATAFMGVVGIAWLHYWNVEGGFAWILNQGNVARGSLVSLAGRYGSATARWIVFGCGLTALAAVMLVGMVRVRDAHSFGRIGALAMMVFLVGCVPNFAPWYHLWWMPLFAVARADVLERIVRTMAFAGPLAYGVFVATHAYGPWHETLGFVLCCLWPAALVAPRCRELMR